MRAKARLSHFDTIARLKDGVSVQAALADMKSIARQLEKQYPDTNRDQGANVMLLSDVIVGGVRPILLTLLTAAGLLLLTACINVTSLVEAAWLAIAGTVVGVVCSMATARLMQRLLFGVGSWDVPTFTAVAVMLVASALLASYIPARRAASVNPVEALRSE